MGENRTPLFLAYFEGEFVSIYVNCEARLPIDSYLVGVMVCWSSDDAE